MAGAPRTPDDRINLTGPVPMLKTFTRPITFSVVEELLPDTDLFEHYCLENEKDDAHMPGRAPK
jgi:hypothetical protein